MGPVTVGIEKIRVYPTSLKVDFSELAGVRKYDQDYLKKDLMVIERGITPGWEDAVTMAVNAAKPMLTQKDIDSISYCVVATETSVDQEKSISSWVHHYLGLPSHCRNFEVKGACYSGTAAMRTASFWLMSGLAKPGEKALIITTDQSLPHLNAIGELVGGGGAVAILLSNEPNLIQYENEKFGIFSHEVSDIFRPLPWIETGNNEVSLFSYIDGLLGAYDKYVETVKEQIGEEVDFDTYFKWNIYHVPFSGMSFVAHKQLFKLFSQHQKDELRAHYDKRTAASIKFSQRIGGTYAGSIFIALLGLIANAEGIKSGDRVGIFSYGSGSCAEFYSGLVGEKASEIAKTADLGSLLESRQKISIEDYEYFEHQKIDMWQDPGYRPNIDKHKDIYQRQYEKQDKLIYKGSKEYYREYDWS